MNKLKPLLKSLKNRILLGFCLVSIFLSISMPSTVIKGCGFIYEFMGYSFIDPEIVNLKAPFAPFFLKVDDISKYYEGQEKVTEDENVQEWKERYCDKAPVEDVQAFIYGFNVGEFERLKTAIMSPSLKPGVSVTSNKFANYIYRNKCKETVDYLIYAKYCEPNVGYLDPWSEEERDVAYMSTLIEQGLEAFDKTESHYIRLRYAFQIIRLAHYIDDYNQVISLYDELMPKIDNDPSVIEQWIVSHRAGALMSLGQTVEASYLFSRIFAECPSRRTQAFNSFSVTTDEEWRECLKLCNSDRERADLYAIRANANHSNILEEMYHIYNFDPQNENLELLLLRELQKLEKDLLGIDFNEFKSQNKQILGIPRSTAGDLVLGMQKFVNRVIEESKVNRLDLWKITKGYLEFLSGNFYYAEKTFEEVSPTVTDEILKKQLDVFQLALKINSLNEVSDSIERWVFNVKNETIFEEKGDFNDFLEDKLAQLYNKSGDSGKSFMMHHELRELKPNPNLDVVEDLLEVARNPTKNRFERSIVNVPNDTITIESELLDIKATYYLSNFQIEAAMETYKKMPESNWNRFGLFDPFIERINDCVFDNCFPDTTQQKYNKGEIMQYIIDLDYQAKANPELAAKLYYKLGIAYYNMTYFGYAWDVMDYFRSGSSLPRWTYNNSNIMPLYGSPYGNKENFDCSLALSYFDKVLLFAEDDSELAAKAAYMAAKCERNNFYTSGGERTYKYFDILLNKYGNTQFALRMIGECKYFEAYATK